MPTGSSSRVIAACFGLAAFAVAIIAGLAVDNPAEIVLGRAIVCMCACNLAGGLLGAIAMRAVNEHLDRLAEESIRAQGGTPGAAGASVTGAPAGAARRAAA